MDDTRRTASMEQYERDKIPPFKRAEPLAIDQELKSTRPA